MSLRFPLSTYAPKVLQSVPTHVSDTKVAIHSGDKIEWRNRTKLAYTKSLSYEVMKSASPDTYLDVIDFLAFSSHF